MYILTVFQFQEKKYHKKSNRLLEPDKQEKENKLISFKN